MSNSYRPLLRRALTLAVFAVITTTAFAQTPEARYEYLTWDCEIKGNKYVLRFASRLTLYDERAKNLKSVTIFENSFQKLKDVKISALDSDGKEIYSRKKKDLRKACGYGSYELYTDICRYMTSVDAPGFPYSIEVEYVLESKSLFFWRGQTLHRSVPVDSLEYALRAPAELKFNYRVKGLDITPVIDSQKNKTTYTWSAKNVPEYAEIDYVPAGYNEPAKIMFAAQQVSLKKFHLREMSWSAIGRWYSEMAADCYLEESEKNSRSEIVGREFIEKAYNNLIERVRYVAIQIGVGGWRPYEASLTRKRGYGDCKDMSTLLISELRNAGITAYPALVRTRDLGPLDQEFPYLEFNHLITVAVDGSDTLWMDPTCSNCAFGELPPGDEGILTLVAVKSGGELWRTPASVSSDNHSRRDTRFQVSPDLSISFVSTLSLTGNFALSLRGSLQTQNRDERQSSVDRLFRGAGKRFRIQSFDIEGMSDRAAPLVISVRASVNRPAKKISSTIYCEPFLLNGLGGLEEENLTERTVPLNLYYPELMEDYITVVWDSAIGVDSVVAPTEDSVITSVASYTYRIEHDAAESDSITLSFVRDYAVFAVDTSKFSEFEAFRDGAKKLTSQKLKLILGTRDSN